jgi:hypothetical protein
MEVGSGGSGEGTTFRVTVVSPYPVCFRVAHTIQSKEIEGKYIVIPLLFRLSCSLVSKALLY